MVVVLILGILAAVVVPQISNAGADARTTNLRTTLANVRTQLAIFKAQHNETSPTVTAVWTLLTTRSDSTEANSASPTGTKTGPYLMNVPANPFNNLTGATSAPTDAAAGWYYDPTANGEIFRARNVDGSTNTDY